MSSGLSSRWRQSGLVRFARVGVVMGAMSVGTTPLDAQTPAPAMERLTLDEAVRRATDSRGPSGRPRHLPSLKRLMQRLHLDAAFRAEFEADPPRAAAALGFTEHEEATVATRDQDHWLSGIFGGPIGHCTICCVVVCITKD